MSAAAALPGGGAWAGAEHREAARWLASFAAMLGLHALAVALVVGYRSVTIEPGEALPAVMIDMAPPPSAPVAEPSEVPPSEDIPEAAVPEPVLDAPPDIPEPDIPPPEPVVTAEVPPPERLPDIPPIAQVLPPPPPVQANAEAVLPPTPQPAPAPKPEPKKVVERKPPKPVAAKRAEQRTERRPPAQQAGAQTTSSLPNVSAGSSAASRSSWQGALVAHLRRNLRPQPDQTGAASVRFSVDRSGRVLGTSLVASAGRPDLDAEAIAVFRRAQPLPAPPADVPGGSFTFTIPIRFTTR